MHKVLSFIIIIFFIYISIVYSLTYQIRTQVVSVNTTATKLPTTPLVGREYIRLQNVGTVTVYIGSSTVAANTSATGGIQLLPYGVWEENYDNTIDIYGKVASGSTNVTVEEGK